MDASFLARIQSRYFARPYWRLWIYVVGIVISVLIFEEIADDVFQDPQVGDYEAVSFDRMISGFFAKYQSPELTQVMIDLTALGSLSVNFVLLLIFISILFTYKDRIGMSYLLIVASGAGIWPWVLKLMYERARPDIKYHLVTVSDLSFPSGHSFGATAIYMALAYYAGKYAHTWRHELFFYILGAILILLVGVSRIYLGVHYPTDVIAGVSGGACWALLVSLAYSFRDIRKRRMT